MGLALRKRAHCKKFLNVLDVSSSSLAKTVDFCSLTINLSLFMTGKRLERNQNE